MFMVSFPNRELNKARNRVRWKAVSPGDIFASEPVRRCVGEDPGSVLTLRRFGTLDPRQHPSGYAKIRGQKAVATPQATMPLKERLANSR
jgi:hypothetical protein